MKIAVEEADLLIEHNGHHFAAKVQRNGNIQLTGRWRDEWISGHSVATIKKRLQQLDDEVQAKKDRQIKLASTEPLPALLWKGDALIPIQVRGTHKSSGEALIVRDGKKSTVKRSAVLRLLNDEERAEIDRLLNFMELKEAAIPHVSTFSDIKSEHPELFDVELTAHYEPETDDFVTEFQGKIFHFQDSWRFNDVFIVENCRNLGFRYIVSYRYNSDGDGKHNVEEFGSVDPAPHFSTHTELFRTREATEQWVSADQAYRKAQAQLNRVIESYQFNFNVFKEVK
jgi:hypothetical protein